MSPGSRPVRSSTALMAVAARSSTGTSRRAPPNVPTGVRMGATIAARRVVMVGPPFTSGLRVPGPELRLHQLARLAARQVIHEAHGPGRLEAGDLRLDERDDLLLELRSGHGAGGGLHERGDRLAHLR